MKSSSESRFTQPSSLRAHLWKFFRLFRHSIGIAIKVGMGSALAILIAQTLQLSNATSAGTITLLTLIVGTRKETIRLILWRILSFVITVALCAFLFSSISQIYLAYALFLFLDILILECLKWQSTLSVNAVIGIHFLINRDFSLTFIGNEFVLLLIGTLIAFLLNLIQPVFSDREKLFHRISVAEEELATALHDAAAYLRKETATDYALKDLSILKEELNENIRLSSTFAQNSFRDEDKWFMYYFEARLLQCMLLLQLHGHVQAIRETPATGHIVADYIESLCEEVAQSDPPQKKLDELHALIVETASRCEKVDQFRNQAMLYHVLLDLEEYLQIKQEFIESLSPEALVQYQSIPPIGSYRQH